MLSTIVGFSILLYWFLMFWFFSFLGWIVEGLAFIIEDRKLVNRGFLIGPYCPIYGFGAIIMLLISKLTDNLFVFFILALVLCSAFEYFISFLMESLFQVRWWDYSNDSFNINGRVCLRNALAFGGLGVLFIRYLKPLFDKLIGLLSYNEMYIISLIVLIITAIDIIVSINAMSKVKDIVDKNIDEYKNKDATTDIRKLVNTKIPGVSFLQRRLIATYHLFDREKDRLKKTIKKVNEKTKTGYGLFLIMIIIGLIIGLILSLVFKIGSYKIVLPFALSVSSLIAALILKVGDK